MGLLGLRTLLYDALNTARTTGRTAAVRSVAWINPPEGTGHWGLRVETRDSAGRNRTFRLVLIEEKTGKDRKGDRHE